MRLWADFNETYEGEIWTSLRRARKFIPNDQPRVGQWVELWDHEGNTCWGIVTRLERPIVHLRLDMSTWRDGDTVQIEPEFVESAPSSRFRDIQSRTEAENIPVGRFS